MVCWEGGMPSSSQPHAGRGTQRSREQCHLPAGNTGALSATPHPGALGKQQQGEASMVGAGTEMVHRSGAAVSTKKRNAAIRQVVHGVGMVQKTVITKPVLCAPACRRLAHPVLHAPCRAFQVMNQIVWCGSGSHLSSWRACATRAKMLPKPMQTEMQQAQPCVQLQ